MTGTGNPKDNGIVSCIQYATEALSKKIEGAFVSYVAWWEDSLIPNVHFE